MKGFVAVGDAQFLRLTSARHHITLRQTNGSNRYHSLLLFSFPAPPTSAVDDGIVSNVKGQRFYCMEAVCPHLGAPLENASIYDVDDEDGDEDIEDAVIVCPWHEYDFSLSSGESSTGLKACVYAVKEDDTGQVYVAEPECETRTDDNTSGWQVIEVRPVSEAATRGREAAATKLHSTMESVSLDDAVQNEKAIKASEAGLHEPDPLPRTLVEWAVLILNTPEPKCKVAYTRLAARAFRSGACRIIGGGRWIDEEHILWQSKPCETPPNVPSRLADAQVVQPGQVGRRGKGGSERSRIAMLHSLANIEQWAIDLAWDIIARAPQLFAQRMTTIDAHAKLPLQFFSDFVKVAEDEAKHFTLLQERLEQMGSHFGALPVHHGLWDSARETMHSLDARLSIIHLVHEARGLDANPLTIKKFDNAGDKASVELLNIIHADEVTHVSAGHRWLTYLCGLTDERPVDVFRSNVRQHFAGKLKGPFNASDRTKAGLTREWYEDLTGEKGSVVGVERAEVAGG